MRSVVGWRSGRRACAIVAAVVLVSPCCAGMSAPGAENVSRRSVNRGSGKPGGVLAAEEVFADPKVQELAVAAAKGRVAEVKRMVEGGVSVDSRGKGNVTPLFYATRDLSGFTLLLELGANPNVIFDGGNSVMHWAAGAQDHRFLDVALRHGGDPNLVAGAWPFGGPPIFRALGSIESVKLLMDSGADLNARAANGDTPVMRAAGLGWFDVAYFLLEQGADYRFRNGSGVSLIDRIANGRRLLAFNPDMSPWMTKVVAWLKERGMVVPDED